MATVQQFVVASIIFISIFAGAIITQHDFQSKYGLKSNDTFFTETGEQEINEFYELANETASKFDQSKSDTSNLDALITGGLNSIKITFGIVPLVTKTITRGAIAMGIPTWVLTSVLAVVLVTIILALIGAIVGRRTGE